MRPLNTMFAQRKTDRKPYDTKSLTICRLCCNIQISLHCQGFRGVLPGFKIQSKQGRQLDTAETPVLTCVLHVAEKKDKTRKVPHLVLYVFWVCMGANPTCFPKGEQRKPDHMLSYKQCTVLVFAGKLMWLSVYFNTNRRSLYTAFKEWKLRVFMSLRKVFNSPSVGGF